MKNLKLFYGVLIIVVLVIVGAGLFILSKHPVTPPSPEGECKSNNDCDFFWTGYYTQDLSCAPCSYSDDTWICMNSEKKEKIMSDPQYRDKKDVVLCEMCITTDYDSFYCKCENNKCVKERQEVPTIEIYYHTSWGPLVADYEINIDNEGDITLTDNSPQLPQSVQKTVKLSEDELKELKELIIKADVFGFKDDYSCISNCVVDGTSRALIFKIDGETKDISSYEGSLPDELGAIIAKIQQIQCSKDLIAWGMVCPEK